MHVLIHAYVYHVTVPTTHLSHVYTYTYAYKHILLLLVKPTTSRYQQHTCHMYIHTHMHTNI